MQGILLLLLYKLVMWDIQQILVVGTMEPLLLIVMGIPIFFQQQEIMLW